MMKIALYAITMLLAVQSEPGYTPTSGYEPIQIAGFRILFNKELKNKEPELAQEVIKELTSQIHQVNRKVPKAALETIKKTTTIWVELDNSKGACHHPNRQWLINNNYNPDKAGCVEIGNANHFVNWTKQQPSMVLHELAHHYHWKVLGCSHAGIKKQYQEALRSGSYESILHVNGRRQRAYAMNNEKEYFAETTEAFFGTNDMYPFVRGELKVHDPNMYILLDKLWNNPPSSATENSSISPTKSKVPKQS